MNILLPGQYPRSESLVAATRDYDRGRLSGKHLADAQTKDFHDLEKIQKGFPYISGGLFHWQDLVRPFSSLLAGANAESLSRFFETNTFWRLLELKNGFQIKEEELEKWVEHYFFADGLLAKDARLVFTLPFVYLFRDFSRGFSLQEIVKLLGDTAKFLGKFPHKAICFYEPVFGWRAISEDEQRAAIELLEEVKRTVSTPLYVQTSFFSLKGEWKRLYELPADGYGVDFYANSFHAAMQMFPKNKTLLAGFINTNSTLIEKEEQCREFFFRLRENLPENQVFLTPSGPPELLPREVMDKKVLHLKEMLK